MSDRLLLEVWRRFPKRQPSFGTFLAIADAADDCGGCCISMERLAANARISKTSVLKGVKELLDENYIIADRPKGLGRTQVYQIRLQKLIESSRPELYAGTEGGAVLPQTLRDDLLERVGLRRIDWEAEERSRKGKKKVEVTK